MTTFIHLFIHISINPSNVFVELLKQSPACFLCLYCFPSFIVKCPRGMYYNKSSSTCEKCPVGFISTAEGSFKCEACPSMKSTEGEGSKICIGNSIFFWGLKQLHLCLLKEITNKCTYINFYLRRVLVLLFFHKGSQENAVCITLCSL